MNVSIISFSIHPDDFKKTALFALFSGRITVLAYNSHVSIFKPYRDRQTLVSVEFF
jgi:hypothetical protein